MESFVAQIVNGCALGGIYALFGIAFGMMFSTLGVLNAAMGSYASIAAIVGLFAADDLALPFSLALGIGVFYAAVIAVLVDQLAFQPLRRQGGGLISSLIASMGFWVILDGLAGYATRQPGLNFPVEIMPSFVIQFGQVQLPAMQIVSLGAIVLVTTGAYAVIARSRFGSAMRAVGYHPDTAAIAGVNVRRVAIYTALMSGGIAGLAGVLAGVTTGTFNAALGQGLMLKGMTAAVIGGYADVRLVAIAGILFGVVEVLCASYVPAGFRDGFAYVLLIGFLLLRHRSLLGGLRLGRT